MTITPHLAVVEPYVSPSEQAQIDAQHPRVPLNDASDKIGSHLRRIGEQLRQEAPGAVARFEDVAKVTEAVARSRRKLAPGDRRVLNDAVAGLRRGLEDQRMPGAELDPTAEMLTRDEVRTWASTLTQPDTAGAAVRAALGRRGIDSPFAAVLTSDWAGSLGEAQGVRIAEYARAFVAEQAGQAGSPRQREAAAALDAIRELPALVTHAAEVADMRERLDPS